MKIIKMKIIESERKKYLHDFFFFIIKYKIKNELNALDVHNNNKIMYLLGLQRTIICTYRYVVGKKHLI